MLIGLMLVFYSWVAASLTFTVSNVSPATALLEASEIRYADYFSSINQCSRLILNMLHSAVRCENTLTLGHAQRFRGGNDEGRGPAFTSHVGLDYELEAISMDDTCRP